MDTNIIIHGNCINLMESMQDNSVELTLTDIPYGVINRNSNGLRDLDKQDADVETFDIEKFLKEVVRITKGSIYIFCSTEQVSLIRSRFVDYKLTTRLCIWEKCLSGKTRIYVKSNNEIRHSSIGEIARLKCRSNIGNYYSKNNYCLWDGNKWNPVLDIIESGSESKILRITLRSGESLKVTENHKFLVNSNLKEANELKVGDVLDKVTLPNSDLNLGGGLTKDVPWFVGLYLAEGSRSGTDIQLSLNIDELHFVPRVERLCKDYVGNYYTYIEGNKLSIIVTGDIIKSFVNRFILGDHANTKRLTSKVWEMDNLFLKELLLAYLQGDGGYDIKNNRYRLGFSRNEHLTNDLRTLCARLNYDKLTLKNGISKCNGKIYNTKQGNIKLDNDLKHHNCKRYSEIIEIKEVSKRNKEKFWDIVLKDDPHVFCLSSGVLSHNSNPSPMNGQHIWLSGVECCVFGRKKGAVFNEHCKNTVWRYPVVRNQKHPTQKPLELFKYLVRVSSNPGDIVFDPCVGSGTTALAAMMENRRYIAFDVSLEYVELAKSRCKME